MRVVVVGGPVLLALAGCANEYHPEYHPQSTYTYEQSVSYPTAFQVGGEAPPATGNASGLTAAAATGDPSNVLVLQSTHLDRPAEVVGVVDAHLPMGSHDSALDVLRKRAASMGADAVVGVEFHHGEGEGQPTHLSGLAVRFIQKVPYPIDR
jgi:hypothetical protein